MGGGRAKKERDRDERERERESESEKECERDRGGEGAGEERERAEKNSFRYGFCSLEILERRELRGLSKVNTVLNVHRNHKAY